MGLLGEKQSNPNQGAYGEEQGETTTAVHISWLLMWEEDNNYDLITATLGGRGRGLVWSIAGHTERSSTLTIRAVHCADWRSQRKWLVPQGSQSLKVPGNCSSLGRRLMFSWGPQYECQKQDFILREICRYWSPLEVSERFINKYRLVLGGVSKQG